MLNQTVVVGRIAKDLEMTETDKGKKYSNFTLAVTRQYKNNEGVYETDFINCKAWGGVAENTLEYCKKGDLLGIKGRLETSNYEKDGQKVYNTTLIAEKVTFLSSCKTQDKNVEQEI